MKDRKATQIDQLVYKLYGLTEEETKIVEPFFVVYNWMRYRNAIEYLGIWKTLHNPNSKPI